MSLEILSLFGAFGLEGPPRPGRRRFGVPPGGAFDQESWQIANALVGNDDQALALEVGMGVGEFRVAAPMRLAVIGAEAVVEGRRFGPRGSAFDVALGEVLSLRPPVGARSYLAVRSGWREIENKKLAPSGTATVLSPPGEDRIAPTTLESGPLRVIRGPNVEPATFEGFASRALKVSQRLDRVGIRLEGSVSAPLNAASEPACVGAVQLTQSEAIILGPDGPPVGGYVKVAVVCRADLSRLGQLRPGDNLTFTEVQIDEARDLWRRARATFEARVNSLKRI